MPSGREEARYAYIERCGKVYVGRLAVGTAALLREQEVRCIYQRKMEHSADVCSHVPALESPPPGSLPWHSSCSAGIIRLLKKDDFVCSTYRDHVHALSKGLSSREVMAELFGKKTGCCRGQGGSMHMFSKEWGLVRAVWPWGVVLLAPGKLPAFNQGEGGEF